MKKKLLKKELKQFKKIISELRDKILEEVKHISEDAIKQSQREAAGDISTYTYHMADIATDTYDREFSIGLASNERRLLYEIEDALKRIDDGSFGICEECKKLISKSRLKAVPYTRLCLKCQSKREKG